MSYGLGGACETASNISTCTDGEYHQYLSHYNTPSRSHQQSRPYSNGFQNPIMLNGHNRLDDTEEHQQQIDGDYEEIAPDRPRLLMWGLTKSGKTSIIKLIFEKMTAGETLQLPETKIIQIHELTCGIHVRFQIRDVPGPKTASLLDYDTYSSECTTIVFILDATDDCSDSINLLVSSVQWMHSKGLDVRFEVLIHKIDGVHEQDRLDRYSHIQQQVTVMLHECSIEAPLINFYLTSIYDHSIFEAFSKIVQNQMRQLRVLENMLDLVTATTQLDKIFVCDIYNKIFLASDTKPVESQISELCCDVVDVYTDISSIYGKSNSPVLDPSSYCTIELSIGLVLYLKDINETTALICILKKESNINGALMEVNLNILKQNIQELFVANSNYSPRQQLNTSTE
ncbi:unnamed protein product [Adineta steineri]|uniref:GTP-binding protein n=1 Tax=Adineta steineri TaxID=433720 RepID=A0A815CSU0_9BILA|nr:unnamed protein product [Adineta steineri]CAF1331477.1 unnamed protein product [Adineta steineri]CAF1364232.1 unnamed protein product [Adineta steineri]CAF3483330.1 unnamed protein product [Adineta steineri]CAF3633892.1 unnamed protein product [Adineta steineri]